MRPPSALVTMVGEPPSMAATWFGGRGGAGGSALRPRLFVGGERRGNNPIQWIKMATGGPGSIEEDREAWVRARDTTRGAIRRVRELRLGLPMRRRARARRHPNPEPSKRSPHPSAEPSEETPKAQWEWRRDGAGTHRGVGGTEVDADDLLGADVELHGSGDAAAHGGARLEGARVAGEGRGADGLTAEASHGSAADADRAGSRDGLGAEDTVSVHLVSKRVPALCARVSGDGRSRRVEWSLYRLRARLRRKCSPPLRKAPHGASAAIRSLRRCSNPRSSN